ncbi:MULTISPECIES: hypothetical protein [unclassified Campylobacter]|uniref:hypothetical protein n=1 Tax=unclassified Campylobacter TaxID=2593542 RepID=UPI001237A107|nr:MULTISPECIES: hypothetical protein [unclassified Campylobacter]KAA6228453.1 hypothetical protein FMM54_00925 [Campylobacter sp. LR185c]KAA6228940.1 hypothetical protein FMM55_00470 [Campylobacter sp. LR196d]KAA6229425.1 hypothetical protein FMM57_00930 [Campylobacter sp. LR286c]KAA6229891.1 hypothetical protein FMM56_07610 [Campylobacter sp. LR264d]KAA6234104.1 hypothetical protein FMM58_01025 [Campylobacter sp. LR291e]
MLSYKLGKLMIQESKSLKDYIKLPFKLLNYAKIHKKEQEFYEISLSLNPSLKRLSLEEYSDHDKALRYKEHLSYKLG